MNDKWMKDLKDLSGDFRKKSPEGLLNDIKREMSRRAVVPANESGKVSAPMMQGWQRAAAVVALLLASSVALHFWNREEVSSLSPEVAVVGDESETPAELATDDTYASAVVAPSVPVAGPAHRVAAAQNDVAAPSSVNSDKEDGKKETPADGTRGEDEETQPDTSRTEKAETSSQHKAETPSQRKASASTSRQRDLLAMNTSPKRRSRRRDSAWGIGAYYGGGGNWNLNGPGTDNHVDAELQYDAPGTNNGTSANPSPTAQAAKLPDEHHHHPLKLGISVRYRLNERWSLLSGITYSYLNSDINVSVGSKYYPAEQKLHYLGVPLMASYNLWQNGRFGIHVNAGGEVEKLVKGRQEIDDGRKWNPRGMSVSESSPIFSANAALSFEFHAGRGISIYADPGLTHHFDNGSGVRSFYTAHPWDFNVNVGVRININQ